MRRFLQKTDDSVLLVHVHNAEVNAFFARHRDTADCQIGIAFDMRANHVAIIHLVDMIAG